MAASGNEITLKLRNDIKNKLNNIGTHVDDELPDYIMVMVANQRTKYEMKDELSLFLGKNTDEFVDWLHEVLKTMELKASVGSGLATKSKKRKKIDDTNTVVANGLENDSTSDTKKKKVSKKDKKKRLKTEPVAIVEEENPTSSKEEISTINQDPSPKMTKKEEDVEAREKSQTNYQHKEVTSINQSHTSTSTSHSAEARAQGDSTTEESEVVLQLRTDLPENDELLQETHEENISNPSHISMPSEESPIHEKKAIKLKKSHKEESIVPASMIGAVVTNKQLYEDENDDENEEHMKSGVASVVLVSERKSSIPKSLQASTKLVLKAVQEANKSIREGNLKPMLEEDLDIPYTPTPIKKRLGPRIADYESSDERLDTENINYDAEQMIDLHFIDQSSERMNEEAAENEVPDSEMNENQGSHHPRFIVTLDGISRYTRRDRQYDRQDDDENMGDELLLDEEMEEEFQENDESLMNRNRILMEGMHGNDSSVTKIKEKCKYWPNCKNGNRCSYYHPNSPCRSFPNCKFGDKCLFIHPECKFDALCTRPDCPFTHSSKRVIPPIPPRAPVPVATLCRYYPHCVNPTCPFLHPKPCNFGMNCRNPTCPFTHPPAYNNFKTLPKPHQLKWKQRSSLSDRKFAADDGQSESMPVTIDVGES